VALAESRTPFSIITRGPLAWRDVDVLQEASLRARVGISFSVPTLDDRVWRATEPGTAPPRSRLAVVARLAEAGIDVGVALAPLLPGISDGTEQLAETVRAARQAGARSIWAAVLNLRTGTREHFLDALAREWPEQLERYEELYAERAYLPASLTAPTIDTVRRLAREHAAPRRPRLAPAPEPEQLVLV
jgi:DNA repair photolyase